MYEMNRETALRFADTLGHRVREDGDELIFQYCPYCNGGHSHDKNTFSLSLKNGGFQCMRSSCGKRGHFVELCRDFGFDLEITVPKSYKRLKQPHDAIKPKDEAIEYLASRGISRRVAEEFEITVRSDAPGLLVFPFYDDKGQLVFIKYRNTKATKQNGLAKETCEADTMPILFGMKQAKAFDKPLVITEGQMDSLSLAEAGIANACSVPTGANGFTWLPYCREWMKKFPEIIVFGDYEHGQVTLYDTLKSRMTDSVVKVVRTVDYLGEKDANDILRAYGTDALRKAVENAETPLNNWVRDLSTVDPVDITKLERINTGIKEVDRTIRGMLMGQVILLTGKRGEGKSTFMSQLVANALDQNENVFVYSGELAAFNFKMWLDFQLAGKGHLEKRETQYGDEYTVTEDAERQISAWYKGRCYIYNNDYIPDDQSETEALPDIIEGCVREKNTRLVCVDNLMTAMDTVTAQENLYLAQSNFVGRLKKIAMKYGVVIILVAHPRKSIGDFSNDDVSGSADITNKVDVVFNYSRVDNQKDYNSKIEITKNRLFGTVRAGNVGERTGAIGLGYNSISRRIVGLESKAPRRYGWEKLSKPGWLDGAEETQEELPF